MGQEYKNVAIIGAGASGCICAYFLLKAGIDVTLFDLSSPLRTLLPTGGGRCNLAHAEYDFKELAKNYPRGEKFLYSIFSKFSTYDTLAMFNEMGIETHEEDDGRIFPKANSAKIVREVILDKLKKAHFIKERVVEVSPNKVKTKSAEYYFTDIVVSIGGHFGFDILKNLDIKCVEQKPSLVGLRTKTNFQQVSGTVLKNVYSKDFKISCDVLFTHFGLSGPLIYKISSIKANESFPYTLKLDLYAQDFDLQQILDKNPHKELKNIIGKFLPQRLANFICSEHGEIKACNLDGKKRDLILSRIHDFEIEIVGTNKGEETVSAGGVDLAEIDSRTLEAKSYPHLYFTGEILDIDGYCGGFNLQNAWSTAFVAADSVINQ